MKIKTIQCNVGRYNLLSSEKSLSFSMAIYSEDDKIYEENGVKALLYYYGEPEELHIFESGIDNITEIFSKCLEYSKRVWGTTDYKAQCYLFYKTYQANFKILEENMKLQRDEEIKKEIEKLQKKISYGVLEDLKDTFEDFVNEEISLIRNSIKFLEKQNSELKEDSESFIKNTERINEHISKIDKYKKLLNYE